MVVKTLATSFIIMRLYMKEVNGHVDVGDWEPVPRSTALEGVTPVASVWSM